MGKFCFIRTSPVLLFHAHTCLFIAYLHTYHCTCIFTLAYFDTCNTLHLDAFALPLTLGYVQRSCCRASVVDVSVCKCKYRSIGVQGIFRKKSSLCFREINEKTIKKHIYLSINFVLEAKGAGESQRSRMGKWRAAR